MNEEYGFFEGDRVVLVVDHPDNNDDLYAGDCGTVLPYNYSGQPTWVSVVWDKNVNGHDCSGQCNGGYGWNVHHSSIQHEVFTEDPFSGDDLSGLLM